ncbi:hypothetical protein L798_10137 [Zootermopsis nevadensis]|uniref:MADF domain-containing protein n=1 Tax=Zootermopsis nevadensis TaxID=136037 RepID=A0A067R0P9_ZOONE|nr:hypothetical protein L798_10137 [Zootermopsis nevadensis]
MKFILFILNTLLQKIRAEHVKILKSRSGGDASSYVTPTWPYYKLLLFVKDQIKNRISQATQPGNETREEVTGEEVECEPRVSLLQKALKRPNTVLGEGFDYPKQKKCKEIEGVFQ